MAQGLTGTLVKFANLENGEKFFSGALLDAETVQEALSENYPAIADATPSEKDGIYNDEAVRVISFEVAAGSKG